MFNFSVDRWRYGRFVEYQTYVITYLNCAIENVLHSWQRNIELIQYCGGHYPLREDESYVWILGKFIQSKDAFELLEGHNNCWARHKSFHSWVGKEVYDET